MLPRCCFHWKLIHQLLASLKYGRLAMPSHVPWIVNGVNGLTLMLAPLPAVEDQKGGHVGWPAVIISRNLSLEDTVCKIWHCCTEFHEVRYKSCLAPGKAKRSRIIWVSPSHGGVECDGSTEDEDLWASLGRVLLTFKSWTLADLVDLL